MFDNTTLCIEYTRTGTSLVQTVLNPDRVSLECSTRKWVYRKLFSAIILVKIYT